jgi:peptide/nickel transport system permease protein
MSDNKIPNQLVEPNVIPNDEMHLDDARRVKVLSPGMLVFKRFIRNSLAVIGLGILLFMFLVSFLGPLLSPYKQMKHLEVLSVHNSY